MKYRHQASRGFIRTIVLVVVALIVLGYLGFNIRNIINSPTVHDNLSYALDTVLTAWNNYLREPATWLFRAVAGRLGQIINISHHVQT